VAGASVMFLVIDIVFYWFLVYTFEMGLWKNIKNRFNREPVDESNLKLSAA